MVMHELDERMALMGWEGDEGLDLLFNMSM
jgi:hypothetical protein